MTREEIKQKAEEARARARNRRKLEEAYREAHGIRVIPLENPEQGPKMGSFAEDFTPEEREAARKRYEEAKKDGEV
ncbi:MAG: hypothetical protein U5L04_01065 [Trueperaceae bacterium]|nr:hypothetical protein [Trueperaceae bacterium]